MNDRREYLKNYRLTHKEKYREYQAKYKKTHLSTYDKLKQENQQLKIKYATEILKQKGITTCINWGGFQLNELDERIQGLINLSEELEKDKSE